MSARRCPVDIGDQVRCPDRPSAKWRRVLSVYRTRDVTRKRRGGGRVTIPGTIMVTLAVRRKRRRFAWWWLCQAGAAVRAQRGDRWAS